MNAEVTVGFIGLGYMGSRLAKRLLQHGYRLRVFNRNRAKTFELVQGGAVAFDHIAELASDSGVILSCLADDQAVADVYEGVDGVLAHAKSGATVIEMSTVAPETSRRLHQLGTERGIAVLDVPISGSTLAAEQGHLTLFAGGEYPVFEACTPIFESLAEQFFYVGPSGSGATMKLVVNALLGLGMQAIAEAVVFGQKAGIDRNRLLEVLSKTAVVAPAHAYKLERAKKRDYSPQFPIRHMNKDFHLIVDKAAQLQVPMPATVAAYQINLAEAARSQEEDFSAVMRAMEELASLDGVAAAHAATQAEPS
ncbi:MAG TPA: NAD(P)-dependent oxidoreductase [Terriglobia bacterium]|nr:NAD(P)-dependent oxidoreductase [Terriglobia bacterium]